MFKGQKGISLIEVCVTIAVLGIITGVGTVQFNKYMTKSEQDNICDQAIIFKTALNSCVQSSRGWHIPLLKNDGDLCNHTDSKNPCTETYDGNKQHEDNHFPCSIKDNSDNTKVIEGLKKRLNFSCPPGVTCNVDVASNNSKDTFYCLDMQKEVSGDMHQLVIQYDIERQRFNFYSNFSDKASITPSVDVTSSSCANNPPSSSLKCVNESCEESSDACEVSGTNGGGGNGNGNGQGGNVNGGRQTSSGSTIGGSSGSTPNTTGDGGSTSGGSS